MMAIVLGTRPEIIKCAPIIHEATRLSIPFAIIHTGQHYTPELDELFFRELGLPEPVVNLHVGSDTVADRQTLVMKQRLLPIFEEKKPSVVLVQGDTNSVFAGALSANRLGIPVAHLEAGLRSDDWTMPEEANRVLTGLMSQVHFCPTEYQKERLKHEGIVDGVYVVGNPIVDAVTRYAGASRAHPLLEEGGRVQKPYILLTLHRPSNVDDPDRLENLLSCLATLGEQQQATIIFPVHPRTAARLHAADLWERYSTHPAFHFLPPVGYLDLLQFQKAAQLILTDSGGIQEEANILRVPCVTLRENTERPETIAAGGNVLFAGTDSAALAALASDLVSRPRRWDCPFGCGDTAQKVISILSEKNLL
ncbi:MAG: UDP-N-acetylglucosamine 2-epimerase (non-hydrolyzing) [bacterium]|nr:UDP-N-acetylglucosamine 2-epimerase (non-hydrolyzing) [bacterium]